MTYLYSEPVAFGAELVAELDLSEPNWSFDLVCVWRRVSDGALFGAADAGCSCPVPFEDFGRLEDMTPIRGVDDVKALIRSAHGDRPTWGDKAAFVRAVKKALG